jgi:hypothetical protein
LRRCASSDYLRDSGGFDITLHLAQHPGIYPCVTTLDNDAQVPLFKSS